MNTFSQVYFLGIGGIGMSAIARYYKAKGFLVAGYDRSRSALCETLEQEGILVHYEDDVNFIPKQFLDSKTTLVVYTPAIPKENQELCFFQENGFVVQKRAQVLGQITRSARGLCIAGTHGKTTTSNMTAHLLHSSSIGCNAFLGGIAKNFSTNLVLSEKTDLVVIEADEFDRSFHQLTPYMAVITAADADHLDIYGSKEAVLDSFAHFTSLISPEGCLIMKKGIDIKPCLQEGVRFFSYSANDGGDFHAENIRVGNGQLIFDFVSPKGVVKDVELGVPVMINVENAVAAMAIAQLNGVSDDEMREAMRTFAGTTRRFDFHIKREELNFIDDYAHHPEELKASIFSVKQLFPDKRVCGIFQPHLYTRTRDFYKEFAQALSMLDDIILLDIYPARELPIQGVSSQLIFDEIQNSSKVLCRKEDLLKELKNHRFDVLLTIGAGDIDKMLLQIKSQLLES